MLEEEYQPRRVLPAHLRKQPAPEAPFAPSVSPATASDLPDIVELYNYYVANSALTMDSHRTNLVEWRDRLALQRKLGLPVLVARSPSGQFLGYALAAPWHSRRAARYVAECSIYLGPAATGKGLGAQLLGELIVAARAAKLRELVAIVSDHRTAAASMGLHRKLGFVETSRLGDVGVAFGRSVGSILMTLRLR